MGQQIETSARLGGEIRRGTAMLETDYILFRGADKNRRATRVKILFRDMRSLNVKAGWLRIAHTGGTLEVDLGERAEKWAEKIRSPKGRLDKLGAAAGVPVTLTGAVDAEFRIELAARGCEIREGPPARKTALIFYGAEDRPELARVKSLAARLASSGALWVTYPKGQKHITENDVLAAGRAAGLKDVKVVGFSPTHTALKFVIPLAKR